MTDHFLWAHPVFWHHVTRLGEAQILLPAAVVLALWLARRDGGQRLALAWLGGVAVAAVLTTATKVAFIGWGVGVAALDFTGISGHAMFAAAIYPLLLAALLPARHGIASAWGLAAGTLLAVLIGVSRIAVQAHTWSEVIAGLVLGGATSALALVVARWPRSALPWWLPIGLAVWLLATPLRLPPSRTHDWVTRLALVLSGRDQPYKRITSGHVLPCDEQQRTHILACGIHAPPLSKS